MLKMQIPSPWISFRPQFFEILPGYDLWLCQILPKNNKNHISTNKFSNHSYRYDVVNIFIFLIYFIMERKGEG